MVRETRVFLDTSVIFAAVYSEMGAARMILKLGEAGALHLCAGPNVLKEADAVLTRKSPKSKPLFAVLLDRARVRVGGTNWPDFLLQALRVVEYPPDARVLAEALAMGVDYLVSFDRKHLIDNPRLAALPFVLGTPGDFLAWYKDRLMQGPA